LIEGAFDSRALANMNIVLDRVCAKAEMARSTRRASASPGKSSNARSGRTTLGDLTAAGRRALIEIVPAPR
jgi:hypothetical protein